MTCKQNSVAVVHASECCILLRKMLLVCRRTFNSQKVISAHSRMPVLSADERNWANFHGKLITSTVDRHKPVSAQQPAAVRLQTNINDNGTIVYADHKIRLLVLCHRSLEKAAVIPTQLNQPYKTTKTSLEYFSVTSYLAMWAKNRKDKQNPQLREATLQYLSCIAIETIPRNLSATFKEILLT